MRICYWNVEVIFICSITESMLPEEQNIVSQTEEMVKSLFLHEGSGHDWRHIHRVWQTAISIALEEKANTFIVSLIALLHDIADYKFHD